MPVREWPYRHFYLTDVFPAAYYAEILTNLPIEEYLRQIGEVRGGGSLRRYKERFCLWVGQYSELRRLPEGQRRFWDDFAGWLCAGRFARTVIDRLGLPGDAGYRNDVYLVRDLKGYALGPHTDTPKKAASIIFYLTGDVFQHGLGTSLYMPKSEGFQCNVGTHHRRDDFNLVATVEYAPNTAFGFKRSDNSFHGVEPTSADRWCLLYDIHAA